jgi:hypothetical protein
LEPIYQYLNARLLRDWHMVDSHQLGWSFSHLVYTTEKVETDWSLILVI